MWHRDRAASGCHGRRPGRLWWNRYLARTGCTGRFLRIHTRPGWSHHARNTAQLTRAGRSASHPASGIRVSGGVAYADFRDFRHIIPNASSSAGSAVLLDQLDATLKQFPAVHSTVYSFNGDIPAFYEWLQRVPPSTG